MGLLEKPGEAFQFLTDRFQSAPLTHCIMNRADLPEEVLDKIVNLIYLYSTTEDSDMRRRTGEAVTPTSAIDLEDEVVKKRPPLTTFQSLAVVNRKYYRLCLPRLWKDLVFPSPLPAPMSHWTEDILLNHAKLVKTYRFQLQDLSQINDVDEEYSEFEWSTYDNTSPPDRLEHLTQYSQFGIGLMNIRKVFKACPRLESITMQVRQDSDSYLSESSSPTTSRLISLFELVPQLQHLNLWNVGYSADLSGEFVIDVLKKLPSLVSLDLSHFKFVEKSCTEESLGWNLAQLQTLRKLRFYDVTSNREGRG